MATRAVPAPLAQLPNALTIASPRAHPGVRRPRRRCRRRTRAGRPGSSSAIAGITDQVDGWLARRWRGRVGVRQVRRPARRPADDRRRGHPSLRRTTGCPGPRSSSSSSATGCSSSARRSRFAAATSFSVSFLGKAATWVLYASIAFVLVTDPGTDWPLVLFWSGVALALACGNPLLRGGLEGGEAMKAVVMAGGEGTRLRPLTSNQPKPMVPVVGKPCMEHIVELLREHGFDDIVVTLAFMPQAIRGYFGDGRELGRLDPLLRRGVAARHGRLGEARRGRARRDVPRHLRRRAHRHRPRRARRASTRRRGRWSRSA